MQWNVILNACRLSMFSLSTTMKYQLIQNISYSTHMSSRQGVIGSVACFIEPLQRSASGNGTAPA